MMESAWDTEGTLFSASLEAAGVPAGAPPGSGYLSVGQFASAVRAALAPDGIGIRIEETFDGTRLLHVWHETEPWSSLVIPIDSIRLCVQHIETVILLARRVMEHGRLLPSIDPPGLAADGHPRTLPGARRCGLFTVARRRP